LNHQTGKEKKNNFKIIIFFNNILYNLLIQNKLAYLSKGFMKNSAADPTMIFCNIFSAFFCMTANT